MFPPMTLWPWPVMFCCSWGGWTSGGRPARSILSGQNFVLQYMEIPCCISVVMLSEEQNETKVQIEDKLSSSIQLASWHLRLRVKAATSHYQNYLTKTVFHWIAKNLIKSHINRRNKLWVIWQFDEVDTETQCLTFNIAQFCMGVNLINLPHKKSTLTQEYRLSTGFHK